MIRGLGICFLLCLCAGAAHAGGWPAIAPPPHSRVKWVGKDMKLNGVPLRIQQFSAAVSAAEVMGFYRARWGSMAQKKSVENVVGRWQIIGRREGSYYLSVQVQPAGLARSVGFLSVSRLTARKNAARGRRDFPVMAGGRVFSQLESTDPGQRATTITLVNGFSVASNASFYKARLAAQGWQIDRHYGGLQKNGNAYALFFRRGQQEATVVISKGAQGTTVVANIVSHTGR